MRAVPRTAELARILSLPRRTEQSDDLVDALSDFLRRPGHVCRPGCAGGFTRLNSLQAQSLAELHDNAREGRGLFLQGPLGCGKTGVALFAPRLISHVIPDLRALYVVPGSALKSGKVMSEVITLREHWDILAFQTVSYQKLAREDSEFYFFEPPGPYQLIILDEVHYCRNESTAVARRIHRLREHAGQEIEVVRRKTGQTFRVQVPRRPVMAVMTATPVKDSIRDTAHTMEWSMNGASPLPRDESDVRDWADALDAEPAERMAPGALVEFSDGHTDLESVRRGVGRWIFDTPGCISSSETFVDAALEITLQSVPLTDEEDQWFRVLRGDPADRENFPGHMTPNGDTFTEPAELWRHACSLALGYFTRWNPDAPREWRLARYRWHSWAREILAASRTFDTIGHLAAAIDSGRCPDLRKRFGEKVYSLRDVLAEWREIEPTFKPNSVPVWTGETSLNHAAAWLEAGGIVWTGHRHFGRELSKRTGAPYFHEGGQTDDGRSIIATEAPGIIASTVACGAGFNLQRYDRNLIASIWPAAYAVEQTIGRTHRQGQKSSRVTVEWMVSCREQLDGYARAAFCQAPMMRDFMQMPSRLGSARARRQDVPERGWAFAENC